MPTVHMNQVEWFYLQSINKVLQVNGKYCVEATLRGKYDFEYNTPRCWVTYKLRCTVDGSHNVDEFDESMADEIIRYANARHHAAHADHG